MFETNVMTFLSGPMKIDLRAELVRMKEGALERTRRKDLLWWKLCGVLATSGSSVHAKEFMEMYAERLAFDKLPQKSADRKRAIRKALIDAKVPRMRTTKATNLANNYRIVKNLGGPEEATKIMLSLNGKAEKMEWIRQFHGVGSKYSRDIWMDICDPDFTDSIALDARVKSFAEKIGLCKKSKNLEEELLGFAKRCNLTGWQLDRLIFNFGGLIERYL